MSKPKTKPFKVLPGYYDPADYMAVHKDHYSELLHMLRSAHEELTNAGHQELSECECKLARFLVGAAPTSGAKA